MSSEGKMRGGRKRRRRREKERDSEEERKSLDCRGEEREKEER